MIRRRYQPVFRAPAATPFDFPVMIVQQQVVVLAQQDPVGHVGAAAVTHPMLDMVRLAPEGRSIASCPETAAVSLGQRNPLALREETVFSAHVERLPERVEHDGNGSLGTRKPLDRLDRNRDLAALQSSVPCS